MEEYVPSVGLSSVGCSRDPEVPIDESWSWGVGVVC